MKRNVRSLSRQERIMQVLLESGTVPVNALAEQLGVSSWTVRRDLGALEARGLLARRYGEASLLGASHEAFSPPHVADASGSPAAKRLIGRAAARLVQSGHHLALNAGTTTAEVAKALRERGTPCFVVTNALDIASELAAGRNIRVTCTGGEVDADYRTLNGPVAERVLRGHFFDVAVIGVSGIASKEGLTVNSQLNAVALETMLRHAKKVVVVADHTKFGAVRFAHLAPTEVVDALVTDRLPEGELLEHLRGNGAELIVAADPRGL